MQLARALPSRARRVTLENDELTLVGRRKAVGVPTRRSPGFDRTETVSLLGFEATNVPANLGHIRRGRGHWGHMIAPPNSLSRPLTLAVASLLLAACSSSAASDGPASTAPAQTAETSIVAATSAAPAAPTSKRIQTVDYEGVVLAVKSATDAGLGSAGSSPYDGVWQPSAGDIAAFESGLVAHMTKAVPASNKALPAKLKSYKRQWFGLTAGSKKLIYGNFLCHEMPGWEQHAIMVDDGGDCYFQLFYDVGSREYRDLMINGDA